jgi:hypothetical protein
MDYARRPGETIRWQSFTSSSTDIKVALGFPGNVVFEISVLHPFVSLDEVSAFKSEHEFVLSPYQWFMIKDVRWAPQYDGYLLWTKTWNYRIRRLGSTGARLSPSSDWLLVHFFPFDLRRLMAAPELLFPRRDHIAEARWTS